MTISFENFISIAKRDIIKFLPAEYTNAEVIVQDVVKFNSKKQKGLIVRRSNYNFTPTLYLEEYFSLLEKHCMLTIMEKMAKDIVNGFNAFIARDYSLRFDISNIFIRFVNYNSNLKYLQNAPHIKYLDLAKCLCIKVLDDEHGLGFVMVNNNICRTLFKNRNVNDLFVIAEKNGPGLLSPVINDLDKTGDEFFKALLKYNAKMNYLAPDEISLEYINPMLRVSTEADVFGSSVMLYPDFLDKCCESLKCDAINIIPCSVHQLIVVSTENHPVKLTRHIKEMYHSVVPEEEPLSDNTYTYVRLDKKLYIA